MYTVDGRFDQEQDMQTSIRKEVKKWVQEAMKWYVMED